MRLARTRCTLIAALFAPLALLTPTTAHAAPAAVAHWPARHAPGETITLLVCDALAALTVTDESRAGCSRDKFNPGFVGGPSEQETKGVRAAPPRPLHACARISGVPPGRRRAEEEILLLVPGGHQAP